MPGQICAVFSCKSNRLTLKKKGVNVIFHSFPKANDLVSTAIRKEWIKRCNRVDTLNSSTSTICSLHFTPNDYERDLQNELLGLPLRRVLKKTAVPSLFLHVNLETPNEDILHAKKDDKKQDNGMVESLLTNTSLRNRETSQPLLNMPNTPTSVSSSYTEISDEPSTLSNPDTYKQKYEDLLLKYNLLRSNSNKKIKRLNHLLKYYKVKCYNERNKSQISYSQKTFKLGACQKPDFFTFKEKKLFIGHNR